MGTEPVQPLRRPWWVRMAIPNPAAKRKHVLLNLFVLTFLFGIWAVAKVALEFLDNSPYRWLWAGFFAVAAVGVALEFLAVHWMNRAGAWRQ